MFKTFNEFANTLENAVLPPVFKSTKKVQIKIKECDQDANRDYIFDLNSLLSEIKKESKNENLHCKKNKTNVRLRKIFQMKLIQCYKLAIKTTKICSQTLEAGIYNPVQSKMKSLIRIISALSLTTGKYLYGELFKKKKKESFDLVQRCKVLESMLDECGYKDSKNEGQSNNHDNNILNELANKALTKPKTQFCTTDANRLSMYNQVKPKLGTRYAQKWSKNDGMNNKYSYDGKMINKKPFLLTSEKILNSDNVLMYQNLDDIKTAVQKYPSREINMSETNNKSFCNEKKKEISVYTDEVTSLSTTSKTLESNKLETTNNVRLDIVKHNPWRKFPIKNLTLNDNGQLLLNISPEDVENISSYRQQFKQFRDNSKHYKQLDTISKITESIMEDLTDEALSRINDDVIKIIHSLIRMELIE